MTTQAKQDTIEMVARRQDGAETSLTIRAHVSLQAICETPKVPDLLQLALSRPLSWQARNENTLIRVVQSPNLAPQFVAALLAWGAQAIFGEEEGPLAEYLLRTLLHDGRLSAIRVPVDVPGRVWGESHVARTPADEPIVAAIAVVDLGDDTPGELHRVVRQARLALGFAHSEEMVFDAEGHMVNTRFGPYRVYTCNETLAIDVICVETDESSGPFGAKSVAEIPMDGVAPALASAAHDATGVWIRHAPYTPERVWRALHQAEPVE